MAEKTIESVRRCLRSLSDWLGVIEWRLDYLEHIDLDKVSEILSAWPGQCLLTVRTIGQGGQYKGNASQYYALLRQLVVLKPAYLDVEYTVDNSALRALKQMAEGVKLIRSYHNLHTMPDDFPFLFKELDDLSCDLIKMIPTASSGVDVLRAMVFLKKYQSRGLIVHCLGVDSEASRVLAACCGSAMCFVSQGEDLDIPSWTYMQSTYQFDELDQGTKLFGLIGQPVEHSVGHVYHNAQFREHGRKAVYVKLTVSPHDVEQCLQLVRQLDFQGLSVTMPLKEAVCPFVTHSSADVQAMGAANTLQFRGDMIFAANTDSLACVEVLKKKFRTLQGKRALILGAGGAAKAVAWGLYQEGVSLNIVNRSSSRANQLGKMVDADFVGSLNGMGSGLQPVDIVINTLPASVINNEILMNIERNISRSGKCVAMALSYGSGLTLFGRWAESQGWVFIDGQTFFECQAKKQQKIWLN